jgi:hypothetical protein
VCGARSSTFGDVGHYCEEVAVGAASQNWVSVGSVVLSADPQALGNEPPPLAHQLGELAGGKVVDGLVELVGLWSPS